MDLKEFIFAVKKFVKYSQNTFCRTIFTRRHGDTTTINSTGWSSVHSILMRVSIWSDCTRNVRLHHRTILLLAIELIRAQLCHALMQSNRGADFSIANCKIEANIVIGCGKNRPYCLKRGSPLFSLVILRWAAGEWRRPVLRLSPINRSRGVITTRFTSWRLSHGSSKPLKYKI